MSIYGCRVMVLRLSELYGWLARSLVGSMVGWLDISGLSGWLYVSSLGTDVSII